MLSGDEVGHHLADQLADGQGARLSFGRVQKHNGDVASFDRILGRLAQIAVCFYEGLVQTPIAAD